MLETALQQMQAANRPPEPGKEKSIADCSLSLKEKRHTKLKCLSFFEDLVTHGSQLLHLWPGGHQTRASATGRYAYLSASLAGKDVVLHGTIQIVVHAD